jgi:hypothetical protein
MGTHIPFNKPFIAGKEMYYIARAVALGNIGGDGHFTQACCRFLVAAASLAAFFFYHLPQRVYFPAFGVFAAVPSPGPRGNGRGGGGRYPPSAGFWWAERSCSRWV